MELSTIDGAGSINRIRLEFKDECRCFYSSYWRCVLIESDWNLKKFLSLEEILGMGVLIESDWNLKDTKDCIIVVPAGINRIRLEFKDGCFQGNQ